jgi:magnesium transporter
MSHKKRNKKLFQSPVSLNLAKEDGSIAIDIMAYSDHGYMRHHDATWEQTKVFLDTHSDKTIWLNLYAIENKTIIEQIAAYYAINPFIISDAVDFSLRSKSWFTETHLFCSFKMIKPENDGAEHISFILGKGYILSLQEEKADVFDHIRDRIENNYGLIRKKGVDYLFFLLCDALIDQYTLVSDQSEDYLLGIEEQMSATHDSVSLKQLHQVRRDLSGTHKDIRAASDVLNSILQSDFFVLGDFVRKLFTSIIHNSRYSLDSLSRQLDFTTNLSDLYFAQQNSNLNEMIKLLTIMSAFFIPLTFIAGLYGMNFKFMPELNHPLAYPLVLGFMLAVAFFILYIFKRKKWL